MSLDINNYLSVNAKNMRRSAIRDLLSVANKPEIISFGGGFPNADTFPVEDLKEIVNQLLAEEPHKVLQYGSTEGSVLLRKELAKRYQRDGMNVNENNILITTASQQAIDLVSRIFLDPGDTILCGLPSYLGALQAFYSYQANPVGIHKDEQAEVVVKTLCHLGKKPKFIYAIPDYQNPTGVTMSMEQRLELIEVARKYDLIILEDSPYKEIRFDGEVYPTLFSMDPERVILLGTLSKTFAPGLRLGWVLADEQIIERLIVAKQSSDLCTPILNQEIAGRYLASGKFEENLKNTIELYRTKRDLMLKCLDEYMPEGVTWTKPNGGLFMLVTLPEGLNSRDLFDIAIKENVAFIVGDVFFCDGGGQNTMRLNFSYVTDEMMVEGVKRLATAVKKLMNK